LGPTPTRALPRAFHPAGRRASPPAAAAACEGAFLRREGLYSSHIANWQGQRSKGEQVGLEPRKRGRKPTQRHDGVALENQQLRRQVARLEHKLARAEKVIDVQKKISEILGVDQNLPDELKDEES
jgi:transposase